MTVASLYPCSKTRRPAAGGSSVVSVGSIKFCRCVFWKRLNSEVDYFDLSELKPAEAWFSVDAGLRAEREVLTLLDTK